MKKQSRRLARNRRLWWLIAGRLSAILLVSATAPMVSRAASSFAPPPLLTGPVLFLTSAALSFIYGTVLAFSSLPRRFQAELQFSLDVLLITWLVLITGGLDSPYTAFYFLAVSASSYFIGARGALLVAVASATSYTLAMISSAGLIPGIAATGHLLGPSGEFSGLVEKIGLNDSAFFIVGLLAARLAERRMRSDKELLEATSALARLRAVHERIVESIRSGVVTIDSEGQIHTFNAAAAEITGYSESEVRDQHISILFGDIADQIRRSVHAAESGLPSPRYEADCTTSEGLLLRLGFSISPLQAQEGEPSGFVITFQDLTEVRALEESSRRQDRLAAVGRVAAGIAHEIRNPLAAMRGSIQVLSAEMNGVPEQHELMEIVLRESDRLNKIITDFLDYARPRAIALSDVDLREPLQETFVLLSHSPEKLEGHSFTEKLPEEPVIALADAAALRQVFWNLARNALQAMPSGGELSVEMGYTSAGRVFIRFVDSGTGMTSDQVQRLFEPFSSFRRGGTGLGLSIAYQIVRDHGGTINVSSRPGEGTRITIEFPRTSAALDRKTSAAVEYRPRLHLT